MSDPRPASRPSPGPDLRIQAKELDREDELAVKRAEFVLDDTVYLDGNSLGALPAHVPDRVADVINRQWGRLRIRSWGESEWWTAPERIGDRVAPLVGAAPGQIVVGDSTSVNVFKAPGAAVRLVRGEGGGGGSGGGDGDGSGGGPRAERDEIIVDATTFPTDGYIAQSAARLTGCRLTPLTPAEVPAAIGPARPPSCSTTPTTAPAACTTCPA